MKNCYITGIMGFVGSNIAKRMIGEGWCVYGCDDLSFGTIENLKSLDLLVSVDWRIANFNTQLEEMMSCDVIIHCATSNIIYAQTHRKETIDNNYHSTVDVFGKLVSAGKRVIYISTTSVYGNADILPTPETAPIKLTNIYAETKWLAENIFYNEKNACILRLSNVYGINQRHTNPYCGVIGKMINGAISQKAVEIISDGSQTRDFTYVEDVCDAVLLAIEKKATGIYNVSAMSEQSILAIYNHLKNQIGIKLDYYFLQKRSIDNIDRRSIDSTKIQTELGWKPKHTFEQGLQKTIDWYLTETK